MINFENEDNRNPFSNDSLSSSEPDFRVNEFSSGQVENHSFRMGSEQASFPQFGSNEAAQKNIRDRIEAAKSNGWGAQLAGFLTSNKKRMLIIAALVLMFVGGSYLSKRNNEGSAPVEENAKVEGTVAQSDKESGEVTAEEKPSDSSVNVLDIKIDKDGQVLFTEENESESSKDASSITETASLGDGITHLARRAIAQYLNETGKELTMEQKIYAEDYVQNAIGSEWLEVGQKLSFSKTLLSEATEKAQQLEGWQIENLKQYTSAVSLL